MQICFAINEGSVNDLEQRIREEVIIIEISILIIGGGEAEGGTISACVRSRIKRVGRQTPGERARW